MDVTRNKTYTVSDSAGHDMAELAECFDHERLATVNDPAADADEDRQSARLPAYVMHA